MPGKKYVHKGRWTDKLAYSTACSGYKLIAEVSNKWQSVTCPKCLRRRK